MNRTTSWSLSVYKVPKNLLLGYETIAERHNTSENPVRRRTTFVKHVKSGIPDLYHDPEHHEGILGAPVPLDVASGQQSRTDSPGRTKVRLSLTVSDSGRDLPTTGSLGL